MGRTERLLSQQNELLAGQNSLLADVRAALQAPLFSTGAYGRA